ncbi:LysR family transcriptional regulator [Pollutimonas thiosulfatoxidans]|uniref:HTH lysR-type domain-containing protein n=1 Tax=Pollutimonas thiosulfatoxidans TaxID=2028345 RepID=A0A410GEM0_9BURK|nr:LysR family transcriptional regulator [Pollutimonas thiosulfatoxidans]QAA94741.1 hypothetical protein CKA81_13475 [Pollutimonas thiosulfatoxidans]
MSEHLPSTAALNVFKHLFILRSVNKVAEHLHLTPPAVSYQINALERLFGQKLFVRSPHGMKPTEFAESVHFDITAALRHMQNALRRSREEQQQAPVRILATQAFLSLWLLPKMSDLLDRFKGVGFEIISWAGGAVDESSSHQSTCDFEFRYALPSSLEHNNGARLLAPDLAIPVCSPAYLQRLNGALRVTNTQGITMLHARNWPGIWERWSDAAFGQTIAVDKNVLFQSTSLCVQAALSGIGVALVHAPLITQELESKTLVRAHSFGLEVEEAYYAILNDGQGKHANLFEGLVTWCHKHMKVDEVRLQRK